MAEMDQQRHYAGDEIDLRELISVLWNGKWWIVLITGLFAVASVFYITRSNHGTLISQKLVHHRGGAHHRKAS